MAEKLVWVVYASLDSTDGVAGEFQFVLDGNDTTDEQVREQIERVLLLDHPPCGTCWLTAWADLHFFGPVVPRYRDYIRRVVRKSSSNPAGYA
jgi:hypothetical protein